MKNILKLAILPLAVIAMVSCEKVQDELPNAKDLLVFNSVEEYNETVSKVGKMTDVEFAQWEKQQGFTSFYTKAEEVYKNTEPEKAETIEEIFEIVKNNSQFLQLIKDQNDEYTLETTLYKRSVAEQRILNANKMVQVDGEIFKVFEGGVAKVSQENKMELEKFTEVEFQNNLQTDNIVLRKNSSDKRKDLFAKAHHDEKYSTDKKYKLYLGIEIQFTVPFTMGDYATDYSIEYTLRPYKKAIVWVWSKQYCKGSIRCGFSWIDEYTLHTVYKEWNRYIPYAERRVAEERYTESSTAVCGNFYGFQWEWIDCWAECRGIRCEVN